MGRNFQGRDDHSGCDRSPGPSLCNPGTEHPELPHGTSQEESGRGLGVRRSKVTINVFSCEQQKRGGRWAVEKAGPWKARKTKSRFSSLPTALGNPAKTAGFPLFPQPRLLAISQTTSGNLIVVDRKECLTPDTRITGWRLHYCVPRARGGSTAASNRVLLHPECHDRVHRQRLPVSKPRLL